MNTAKHYSYSQDLAVYAGMAHIAYGAKTSTEDRKDWRTPYEYDDFDNWFQSDFDFVLESLMDGILSSIEEDIKSKDSTNLSEQRSAQKSAQSSADRAARKRAGLTGSKATSDKTGQSGSDDVSETNTDDDDSSTADHHHSKSGYNNNRYRKGRGRGKGRKGHRGHGHSESHDSHRSSSDGDSHSRLSWSKGTSQRTGEASTVSSVSIKVKPYEDRYENKDKRAEVNILPDMDRDEDWHDWGNIGGIEWFGDDDNEKITGTSWMDRLFGGLGDDHLVGLEGSDYITGGDGVDRAFGDAGNDVIYTGWGAEELVDGKDPGPEKKGDGGFASGGSGNDQLFGTKFNEAFFGGLGHDIIKAHGGHDYIRGNEGDDTLEAGGGNDEVYGDEGRDKIRLSSGHDTAHGGVGDDTIAGDGGDDDIYGEAGDDIIHGGAGDDELHGGDGDDIMTGGRSSGKHKQDVLKGGAGDDTMYGGNLGIGADIKGNPNLIYMYGEDGNDILIGQDYTALEKLWGGEGDDYILGSFAPGEVHIKGGDGHDTLRPADMNTVSQVVDGGKGDDVINEVLFGDHDGNGSEEFYSVDVFGAAFEDFVLESASPELIGGAGDDKIWATQDSDGAQYVRGGSGNDWIYGAGEFNSEQYTYGGAGRDHIDFGWWEDRDFKSFEDEKSDNLYIWGDYKYGTDDLDKDIWGDADYIDAGTGYEYDLNIYGGDGDDIIKERGGFQDTYIYGEDGDDTFHLAVDGRSYSEDAFVSGGDGDDRWVVSSYEDALGADTRKDEFHAGGKGDDLIYGNHLLQNNVYMWGEEGNDKLVAGDDTGRSIHMSGGDGDDKIYGGNYAGRDVLLYGDWHAHDRKEFLDALKQNDELKDFEFQDKEDWINYYGDDVIMLTDTWKRNQVAVGGYGDDTILGANDSKKSSLKVYGDNRQDIDEFQDEDYEMIAGGPRDGDDIIDIGDFNSEVAVFGQGGHDKILGGINQRDKLYGGDGDDKIWANNEGQHENKGLNIIEGNDGADIIYGSNKSDELHGEALVIDTYGGDDIIYTGYGEHADDGDFVTGGWGNDKIYGEGYGDDKMYGDHGDDKIWGGKGDDVIWGDSANGDFGDTWGDDTLFGGDGSDIIYGNAGDDYMHGGDDDDTLYGHGGNDTIHGGKGDDSIFSGEGWDTLFGGEGCDYIWTANGGDVIWLGTCDPTDPDAAGIYESNTVYIYGTGPDPTNYTVIMDFWLKEAAPYNYICLRVGEIDSDYPFTSVAQTGSETEQLPASAPETSLAQVEAEYAACWNADVTGTMYGWLNAVDQQDNGCVWYEDNSTECGDHDDADFNANSFCCSCKTGGQPGGCDCNPADTSNCCCVVEGNGNDATNAPMFFNAPSQYPSYGCTNNVGGAFSGVTFCIDGEESLCSGYYSNAAACGTLDLTDGIDSSNLCCACGGGSPNSTINGCPLIGTGQDEHVAGSELWTYLMLGSADPDQSDTGEGYEDDNGCPICWDADFVGLPTDSASNMCDSETYELGAASNCSANDVTDLFTASTLCCYCGGGCDCNPALDECCCEVEIGGFMQQSPGCSLTDGDQTCWDFDQNIDDMNSMSCSDYDEATFNCNGDNNDDDFIIAEACCSCGGGCDCDPMLETCCCKNTDETYFSKGCYINTCWDLDYDTAQDKNSYGCDDYTTTPQKCLIDDNDEDFVSADLCCACGGGCDCDPMLDECCCKVTFAGIETQSEGCFKDKDICWENDRNLTDQMSRNCSDYAEKPALCGSANTEIFSAQGNEMDGVMNDPPFIPGSCCACGGGCDCDPDDKQNCCCINYAHTVDDICKTPACKADDRFDGVWWLENCYLPTCHDIDTALLVRDSRDLTCADYRDDSPSGEDAPLWYIEFRTPPATGNLSPNFLKCSAFDDADFTASELCCACGGGCDCDPDDDDCCCPQAHPEFDLCHPYNSGCWNDEYFGDDWYDKNCVDCFDLNWWASDAYDSQGEDCSWYTEGLNFVWCGVYDDVDFWADKMCCACQGGCDCDPLDDEDCCCLMDLPSPQEYDIYNEEPTNPNGPPSYYLSVGTIKSNGCFSYPAYLDYIEDHNYGHYPYYSIFGEGGFTGLYPTWDVIRGEITSPINKPFAGHRQLPLTRNLTLNSNEMPGNNDPQCVRNCGDNMDNMDNMDNNDEMPCEGDDCERPSYPPWFSPYRPGPSGYGPRYPGYEPADGYYSVAGGFGGPYGYPGDWPVSGRWPGDIEDERIQTCWDREDCDYFRNEPLNCFSDDTTDQRFSSAEACCTCCGGCDCDPWDIDNCCCPTKGDDICDIPACWTKEYYGVDYYEEKCQPCWDFDTYVDHFDDSEGNSCKWYWGKEHRCDDHNDRNFVAGNYCCACGGGCDCDPTDIDCCCVQEDGARDSTPIYSPGCIVGQCWDNDILDDKYYNDIRYEDFIEKCDVFTLVPEACATDRYDESDFSPMEQCCACGGGCDCDPTDIHHCCCVNEFNNICNIPACAFEEGEMQDYYLENCVDPFVQCHLNDMQPDENTCVSASDLISARAPGGDQDRVRGPGCKDDGGPLWVTITIEEGDNISEDNEIRGNYYTRWGRFYQKKSTVNRSSRRSRRSRRSRYAQVDTYPTEAEEDLVECFALQICTSIGYDYPEGWLQEFHRWQDVESRFK